MKLHGPHHYEPSIMHMGDCAVCGHLQRDAIHDVKDRTEAFHEILTLNDYQNAAIKTWTGKLPCTEQGRLYLLCKLTGEAGEVAEKGAKLVRDKNGLMDISVEDLHALKLELGDVLWYLSVIAFELGFDLQHVAYSNVLKLRDRQRRGVIKGSGDNR